MKTKNIFPMKGIFRLEVIDKETKEVIDSYDEENTITYEGFSEIINRLTKGDSSITDSWIKTIVLGDDVGTGDVFEPQSENPALNALDQSIVYEIPEEDIIINYTSPTEFDLSTILDGTTILETNFPTDVDMRFTSATIRFQNDKTMSYKRFPVRSLSRLVDIRVVWVISFTEVAPNGGG